MTAEARMIEMMARAMCVDGGFDPSEIMANDGPRWRYYVSSARAALSVLAANVSTRMAIDAGLELPLKAQDVITPNDMRRAIAAALTSAAGDEDRRA